MVDGKSILDVVPRWAWRRNCAKAIIAATTPATRFLIMRAGFVPFQTSAKVYFAELSGLKFDSNELRLIFEAIARHVQRRERHLQAGFEELYQLQLHKDVVRAAPEEAPTADDMRIEFVKDGALKDVLAADLNPRGGYLK